MLTIIWNDPRTDDADEPAWAVWDTACGEYRISYDASTDAYTPLRVIRQPRSDVVLARTWVPITCDQPTLEQAMSAINDYHCRLHNLTAVS